MMHRSFTYCIAFGLLLAPAAFSQTILPTSLPGWNSTTVSATTTANLDGIAGKASAALVEYGASAAEKRTYVGKGHGGEIFSATLYSFKDESGAYGAYSYLRTPEMSRAEYSEHSMKTRDSALVLTGNLVLEIRGNAVEREEPIIRKLIAQMSVQSEAPVYPSLPLQLPTADLIPKTDHYFLGPVALAQFWPGPSATGDWLGFAEGAEAEVAKYRLKGHEATLLVADYPTPQIAAAQLGRMSKQFEIGVPGGPTGKLFARRDGSLVALIADAPSESAANSLLAQVQSGVVVTWNEPAFKLHEPSMADIVVGTIIGTGELCLFTVFGGIVFSLIRLGVKWLWPGKVFDRPEALEILQLGLSTKPIKSEDFY